MELAEDMLVVLGISLHRHDWKVLTMAWLGHKIKSGLFLKRHWALLETLFRRQLWSAFGDLEQLALLSELLSVFQGLQLLLITTSHIGWVLLDTPRARQKLEVRFSAGLTALIWIKNFSGIFLVASWAELIVRMTKGLDDASSCLLFLSILDLLDVLE